MSNNAQTPKNIVIIGATSAIAKATIRQYANQNHNLFLAARNAQNLPTIAKDAKVRGANEVFEYVIDLAQHDQHPAMVDYLFEQMPEVDVVLIAHGTLPKQNSCETDVALTMQEINTNGLSVISLLTLLANRLEAQKSGTIAVISSVAGDRGRQSNYVYGSAKKLVSTFLQGLRNRLYPSGVNVIDIKPGFVDTPMTAEFDKGALWAQPDDIAKSIIKAINKGKDGTLYTPWFWAGIMLIIRSIPEIIFKRLKL